MVIWNFIIIISLKAPGNLNKTGWQTFSVKGQVKNIRYKYQALQVTVAYGSLSLVVLYKKRAVTRSEPWFANLHYKIRYNRQQCVPLPGT